jgi:hypothetical protein
MSTRPDQLLAVAERYFKADLSQGSYQRQQLEEFAASIFPETSE